MSFYMSFLSYTEKMFSEPLVVYDQTVLRNIIIYDLPRGAAVSAVYTYTPVVIFLGRDYCYNVHL